MAKTIRTKFGGRTLEDLLTGKMCHLLNFVAMVFLKQSGFTRQVRSLAEAAEAGRGVLPSVAAPDGPDP